MQEKEEREMAVAGVPSITQGIRSQEPQQNPVETTKKPFKFKVTIFMLCLISVVVAMDSVIVAATLPAITVSLKGTSLEAFWVGTSYLLAQTVSFFLVFKPKPLFWKIDSSQVTIPIYGTISDIL
jgi:MFS family permease